MSRRLVLLGAGHAHLPVLARLGEIIAAGNLVTVISPDPVHYYSGMGPGMLGGVYAPEEIRFPVQSMTEESGATFMSDRAVNINPDEQVVTTESGSQVAYDVLSVNTGSSVAPTVTLSPDGGASEVPRVFRVKPIAEMLALREFFLQHQSPGRLKVVVIGGGPAAVEAAGNLHLLQSELAEISGVKAPSIRLLAGRRLLPGFPQAAEKCTLKSLASVGVAVQLKTYVSRIVCGGVETAEGTVPADVVLLATGVVPSRLAFDSGLPVGPDGGLAVNERLHVLGYRNVFGGGDCIWFSPRPLAKAGVFAVRQGPVLAHNIMAALEDGPQARYRRFFPGGSYLLLLNMGDGSGVFWKRVLGIPVVFRNAAAWRLKDRIDSAFMHKFGSEADRG